MLYTINLKRTVTERKVVKVDSPNADIAAKKAIGRTPGDGWELDGPVRWLSPSIPGANLCATVDCPVSRIAVVFDAAPALAALADEILLEILESIDDGEVTSTGLSWVILRTVAMLDPHVQNFLDARAAMEKFHGLMPMHGREVRFHNVDDLFGIMLSGATPKAGGYALKHVSFSAEDAERISEAQKKFVEMRRKP